MSFASLGLIDALLRNVQDLNYPSKIKQWVVPVDKKNKPELFMHLVAQNNWEHALVFVKTRNGVDYLAAMLDEAGYAVDTIHGDKPQPAQDYVHRIGRTGRG
jgi:superfamily II DNA/RNA helicase